MRGHVAPVYKGNDERGEGRRGEGEKGEGRRREGERGEGRGRVMINHDAV